ncbi:MAG TPA: glycosyltransferase family 2 protein [Thermoanaerobaculia bacterium]|jgi:glycosyltransferase involved in cell wall biosynthesis|nr:glycosyltransferase family 2 protein [Thermoanaerobaculia bacterium]
MRVSIVTPSLQQGQFIERTLQSVWRQNRGRLTGEIEHIVMDGGSTDGTLEILERWRDRISFSTGPDGGQSAAINAGLARAGGEILAYLNSDDVYYDGALAAAVAAFEADPSVDVVYGEGDLIDCNDGFIDRYPTEAWSPERLELICFLCQPAVFFRRRVLERFGPFDGSLNYCMDYEYWLRLAARGAHFAHIPVKLAASRFHPATKTFTAPLSAHVEINDMLKERLGTVPGNWLTNYAYAVLDGREIARNASRNYLGRVAALTIGAAFRWNGVPSLSLLRTLTSSLLHGSSIVPARIAIHA